MTDALQTLISKNTRLVHLDLSETGLSADMILELVKAINLSKSLSVVHLSGNPGLTTATVNKL